MAVDDTYEFRDLTGLVNVLKASLVLYILVAIVGLWPGWSEIQLLERIASGESVTEAEAAANDSRQAMLGGIFTLVFIVTAILFARWTYLSNKNAKALGASGMKFSPGWSVGWYFIPVFMLWKPYQALKEIFKASHPDYIEDWEKAPRPGLMPLWWTLWIIATVLGQAIFRTTFSTETIDEHLTSSWLLFFADALDIPLGIVVIALVATLHDWQSRKVNKWREANLCERGYEHIDTVQAACKTGALSNRDESSDASQEPDIDSDYAPEKSSTTDEKAQNNAGPRGVGGWLLLLVIGMMILAPILGAGRIGTNIMLTEEQFSGVMFSDQWQSYKSLTWLVFIVMAAISFTAGWGLARKKDWSVVNHAKAALWITGPGALILLEVIVPAKAFGEMVAVDAQLIGTLFASIIAATIWTAYLVKSKRVRNTYSYSANKIQPPLTLHINS